jgi:hypothetical protein
MLEAGPNPKSVFQKNGKQTFGITEPPIGIPEKGGSPILVLKTRPFPPPKMNLDVGTRIDIMEKITLGKIVE